MPRNNSKDSQSQEIDEEEREIGSAHQASDADEERVPQKSSVNKNNEEEREDLDDEDTTEDIDLDDLQAMEGPDA